MITKLLPVVVIPVNNNTQTRPWNRHSPKLLRLARPALTIGLFATLIIK
jgi:hypothetical protein